MTPRILIYGALACTITSIAWARGNTPISAAFVSKTIGGTGVAHFSDEFDAVIENPGMMTDSPMASGEHKFSLGLDAILFNAYLAPAGNNSNYVRNKEDKFYLPFAGYFYKISDQISFGTGVYVTSSGGGDFSDSSAASNVKFSYFFATIPFAVSYAFSEDSSLGVSANLLYSTFESNNATRQEDTKDSDQTIGATIGYRHHLGDHTVGLSYVLGGTSTYEDVTYINLTDANLSDQKIGTPNEFQLGYGFKFGDSSLTAEYKYIQWASTELYEELEWDDQHMLQVGAQTHLDKWTLRFGAWTATQAAAAKKGVNGDEMVSYQGTQVSRLTLQVYNQFAGIARTGLTAGWGYGFTDNFRVDGGIHYELASEAVQSGTSSFIGAYEIREATQATDFVLVSSYKF